VVPEAVAFKFEVALIVMLALTAPLLRGWRGGVGGAALGARVGIWATVLAGAFLAVTALSIAIAHLSFPGEWCGTTPDAAHHVGLCRMVGVALLTWVLAILALAGSLIVWWPWERPFRLQGLRLAYVVMMFGAMFALSLVGGD
jgi:hypothetical protein